jgi:hypothetical protein
MGYSEHSHTYSRTSRSEAYPPAGTREYSRTSRSEALPPCGYSGVLSDQPVRSLPPVGTREYSRTSRSEAYPVWVLKR